MPETPVISLKNVSFSYNMVQVLVNVSFSIYAGELHYVVGPNGGGKTTLLKIILGLQQPDEGEALIFGKSPKKVRNLIGYVPQHILFDPHFPITVMDVVLMGRLGSRLGGRFSRMDKDSALSKLGMMEMEDVKDRLFSELSGGQRQRVLIARALATEAKILLLDEPTANVDAGTEDKLFRIVDELHKIMTVLMVSHDIGFASESVKSVICVHKNVVVHPTSDISGETIKSIYGEDIRIIRHDLRVNGQDIH